MEFIEFKDSLFKKAKSEGFKECEIYFTKREKMGVSVYEQEVENYSLNRCFNLCFRGEIDGKVGYSFTEVIDSEAMDILIKDAKDSLMALESNDIEFIYGGDKEYSEVNSYSQKLEEIDTEKLINIAMDMEREARNYSDKVENVEMCCISYGKCSYGIYNTRGLALKNKTNFLSTYIIPVISEEENKYEGMGYCMARSLEDIDPKKIAKQGVDEALSRIGAKSIEKGKYKTIIYNEAMVSLLGVFCVIFNADSVQNGLSLLKNKEGEIIASDIVNIIDIPHLEDQISSTPFDDEGVSTYRKEVVSNGKLITLLHNLKTAYKAGVKSTGNGFKSSYSSAVSVAATNFYIENGSTSLKELMEDVEEGVFITELLGLHSGCNSITGDFSLGAKGFYIKDGKQAYPIEQITVNGNFFELIKIIEDIGNDLNFPMCNIGSPSVRVKELYISGL